jgi:hypothetical protein
MGGVEFFGRFIFPFTYLTNLSAFLISLSISTVLGYILSLPPYIPYYYTPHSNSNIWGSSNPIPLFLIHPCTRYPSPSSEHLISPADSTDGAGTQSLTEKMKRVAFFQRT